MATFEPSPDLDPAVAQAIQEAMDSVRAELLPHLASQASAPTAKPASPAGDERRGDRFRLLEEALGALDAAPSQAVLLSELLRQAGRFADRALFLVLDHGRYDGWAAYGFDTDQEHVTRAVIDAGDGPWAEVAGGAAAAELEAEACAELVDQVEGAPATGGILVAFALRGSTAGALYADQLGTDGALDSPALRILTYVAAQVLETLPLRHGGTAGAVADAPTPEEEETAVDEHTAAGTVAAGVDVDELLREVTAEGQAEQDILEIRRDTATPPIEPAAELGATVIDEVEEDAPAGFETESAAVESAAPELDDDIELPGVELPRPDSAPETESADTAFATQEISTLESAPGRETLEAPAAAAPEARPLEPAEVVPPTDLEGPGWAFGGAGTITDDTRHEEARRLARLLVTEIKLYNEEKVREGREHNNLMEQLRDDLERSRRIYDERIDEEIRNETDYFQEECVRILAGGDSTALGA